MSLQDSDPALSAKPSGFQSAFNELLSVRSLGEPSEQIEISGVDPFCKTPFKVGESVAAVMSMVGVAANDLCASEFI